jgi:hypothetical protein
VNPCHQQVTHKCTYLLTAQFCSSSRRERVNPCHQQVTHKCTYLNTAVKYMMRQRQRYVIIWSAAAGYRYFGSAILLVSTRVHNLLNLLHSSAEFSTREGEPLSSTSHAQVYLLTYCTVLLEFSTREGEPLSSTSHAQVYLLKHCSKVYGRRQGYRYFGRAILLASTRVHVDVVSHTYTNTTYFSDTHMHTNTHTQGRQVQQTLSYL